MNTLKSSLIGFTFMATLAGCVEEPSEVEPGRATLGQVEQACVARLAQTARVAASAIGVSDSTGSTEGTAVFLSFNGNQWVCRADGAGRITSLDLQGEG